MEKAMAPHSSTLAGKIPWMEEPWWAAVHGVRKLTLCCCVLFWWEDNHKWLTPVLETSAQILPPLTLLQVEELPWDFRSSAFPMMPSGAVGGLLELVTATEPLPQGDCG